MVGLRSPRVLCWGPRTPTWVQKCRFEASPDRHIDAGNRLQAHPPCRVTMRSVDAGKRPFLDPVLVTNGALAAELAMKALTLWETGSFECIHYLDELFFSLPNAHLDALSSLIKDKAHQNDETLRENLKMIRNFFVEWRYFFESDSIGYSGFLLEFIHIVCGYAMSELRADTIL